MFDTQCSSPNSPVDSAMFPPLYNRSTSSSSTASMMSCPDEVGIAPLPLHYDRKGMDFVKPETTVSMKAEIEPLTFRLNPTPRSYNGSSLSSVFGDQELIDAIMFSLNTEHPNSHFSDMSLRALSPIFALPRVPIPSFAAFVHQRPHGPDAHLKATVACVRKSGTFLNKDGRWIKGKPCRMDGCDKRAQSNGLCKGHGGGARCNFVGCSKSSQGGGFCRAHGGGKRCMHKGCEKGTQRNGFCYLHGGVRSCSIDGCEKKDRGNGKCFFHGGGRKCQAPMCFHTIRRGTYCDLHNGKFPK
ncbi:hypothetical protein CCR75_001744 [Bremia lactucae]|uniref:WRKY19-like zinc finger domain-containing protein n=1 Tax=Bremia lactucae TaxID=4779 RepID=A0A976FRN2_BRELC|nr:hypothetical protein CCR75_001744 [Bremia lactucae]